VGLLERSIGEPGEIDHVERSPAPASVIRETTPEIGSSPRLEALQGADGLVSALWGPE